MIKGILFVAVIATLNEIARADTCGGGSIGDGVCAGGLCCSQWGWCGNSLSHCGSDPAPSPSPPVSPTPVPPTVPVSTTEDSRMIAYLGNWQSCPSASQLAQYTHIVVAFAVSYTWAPSKNQCSSTCQISTPPVCNNAANPGLIADLHAAGKKVILSFGGAGMGGSWAGDVNDCWEYCYGREAQVVEQLTDIVVSMNLDGVDLDYEYFYADNQNGSGFNQGAAAQQFLTQVTVGLRNSLPTDAIVTHAPMDVDMVPGSAYYSLLQSISSTLDFLMPQYYNGITRPVSNFGPALAHYTSIVDDFFDGDATRMVFGFCISDCSGTSSNADGAQAQTVMATLSATYSCNGGAFFWVAEHDSNGVWSSAVNVAVQANAGCSSGQPPVSPTNAPTTSPVTVPTSSAPTKAPSLSPTSKPGRIPTSTPTFGLTGAPISEATPSPTNGPVAPTPAPSQCCAVGDPPLKAFEECKKYYYCTNGSVGTTLSCPAGTLFNQASQICDWAYNVPNCAVDTCGGNPSPATPTLSPSKSPTKPLTTSPTYVPTVTLATQGPTASPQSTPAPTRSATVQPTLAPFEAPTAGPVGTPSPPVNPSEPCCPAGYTGLKAYNDCAQYFHCVSGDVVGTPTSCPAGTLFNEAAQYCDWPYNVPTCTIDTPCGSN